MARTTTSEGPDGLLVIDKPAGWTSHDVVARARRLLGTRKVGHAGTLDPMATGVLVVGVGKATRLLTYYAGHGKSYAATMRLGSSTVTDDAEGEVVASTDATGVAEGRIADAVAALTGDIQQVPSSVSAIKVDGKRSYARVRAGEGVELAARPATVSRFEVLAVRRGVGADGALPGDVADPDGAPPPGAVDLDVEVEVSAGTYVRALARDLGAALGVGGHLTALRRLTVGGIGLDRAVTLERLERDCAAGRPPLLPLADAAAAVLPTVVLAARDAVALGFGKAVAAAAPSAGGGGHVAAVGEDGALVAVVEPRGGSLRPVIVFEPQSGPHRAE